MNSKPFYTHNELAALIGIHPDTFWHWRAEGNAPTLTKVSPRRTVFMKTDVKRWLKMRPKVSRTPRGDAPQSTRRFLDYSSAQQLLTALRGGK